MKHPVAEVSSPATCPLPVARGRTVRVGAALWLGSVLAAPSVAAGLADLSLEQLSEVVVSSVSRRDERLDRSAGSVHVITSEDIRRSGATTLPEALRLAPHLNVARADANQYAISARGFNNVLANKMLVLIDGRTVYTPLFSGVFWQAQDTMIADIDRIEVITGPSAALWGTNAVNGLIHIFTRSTERTQGPAASAELGSQQRSAELRYGASLGDQGHYRVYAKGYRRKNSTSQSGLEIDDAATGGQTGFRLDWADRLQAATIQGDLYQGDIGERSLVRRSAGANLSARWQRSYEGGALLTLRGLLERTELRTPAFEEQLDTVDLLVQYDVATSSRNHLIVGAGHRASNDRTSNDLTLAFRPADKRMTWSRIFAQNQLDFDQRWTLSLAGSIESNPYTGTEALPSARLSWAPRPGQLGWLSASRAVRAPSRIDREFFTPAQPPFVLAGGPNFHSEIANVLEVGYRSQPTVALSYSLVAFRQEYRRLRSLAPVGQGLQFENGLRGRTQGLEASLSWRVNERWRLVAGATGLSQRLSTEPGAVDRGGAATLGNDPSHWWSLRSTVDLTPRLVWDLSLRRSGSLPAPVVPAYTALDMRLAWSLTPDHEVAVSLRNLGDPRHAEWGPAANRIEFGRSASLQFRWRL